MKKFKRLLSVLLVVCILSGMNIIHPGANTATAETLTSKEEINVSDSVETSDDLNMSGKQEDLPQQTENLITDLKENSSVMDYIDESEFVTSQPIKRLKDKEKLNTYVFLNQDGTESVYYMEKNVKYKDANGKIFEKDITLTKKDKSYKVTENDVKLSLSEMITDGVELGYNENSVKLVPKNSKSKVKAVFDEKNNSVTYSNYYGKGIDIRYTPLLNGVKEDIILFSYTGVSSFDFVLYTNGMKIFSDDGSYYIAEKQDSEDKIYLGEIIIYDAVGRPDKGNLTVKTVKDGEEYTLTVSANEEFLTDSLTVYPVTIDPTLEISRNIQGPGSIVDATVFSGFPTENFGEYQYCTLGQINSGYGIARTIVRFDGLANDPVYNHISSNDITNAKFYVKEAAGVAAHNVSVLYNQSSTAWTETGITWNTLSTQLSDPIASSNLNNNDWSYFELTDYVKRCRAGELNISSGLVLKLTSNETLSYTQFNTSEHVTAGFRPYLVVTYSGDASISLNTNSIDIDEGDTYTLSATTNVADAVITWESSDTTIARVSVSTGKITARKAGVVYITARIKGTSIWARCTVFVTIKDGVYVISNMENGKVLDVKNNGIANNTNVLLCPQNSYCGALNQKWRIKHLGQGYYSVRPLHKLDMCLYKNGSNVTIYKSNLEETIQNTPLLKRWTITYERIQDTTSKGYVFKNSLQALTIGEQISSSDYNVIVAERDLADITQYWSLSLDDSGSIRGTRMYDSSNPGVFYDSNYHQANMFLRNIVEDNTVSLSSLHLVPTFYSNVVSDSILQTFQWSSSDSGIASVNSQSGAVTANSNGTAVITGSKSVNGLVYRVNFTASVCTSNSVNIELSEMEMCLSINETKLLVASVNIEGLEVEWSSSDESIATVDTNGVITAKCVGSTDITVIVKNVNVREVCTVHVVLADGIYVIQNMSNNKVLDVENNGVLNKTDVLLCSRNNYCGGLNQKWRISYIGAGQYSISPVHKLDMYLYSDEKMVSIYQTDRLWRIGYGKIGDTSEYGYNFFQGDEVLSYCSIPDSDNGNAIPVLYDKTDRKQFWSLTKQNDAVRGVRVYDISRKGVFYDSNYHQGQVFTKDIIIGDVSEYEDIKLIPAFYSCSITDNVQQDFQLSSSNQGVVTIVNQNHFKANSNGAAIIAGSKIVNGNTYSFYFNLLAIPIEEGVYYIQNRQSELYAQLNNNEGPEYDESGIILEQFKYDARDYQKWSFEHIESNYYKIVSVQSGMVISVKSGEVDDDNVALVQQPYIGEYRQQWTVTKTTNGSYKIKARSAEGLSDDLVMAIGAGIESAQGINVEQRKYLDNDSYKDEWYLLGIKGVTLVSSPDDGKDAYVHYHDSVFEDVLADLYGMGYSANAILDNPSGNEIVDYMTQSEIFVYRGHGEKDYLDLANDDDDFAKCFESLADGALSQCKLVLYGACNVGMGRYTLNNLVRETHSKGAQVVVGFVTEVHCVAVNIWTNAFLDGLALGKNVYDARTYADEFIMDYYGVSESDRGSTRVVGFVDNSYDITDLKDLNDERIIRACHIIGTNGVVGNSFADGDETQVIKLY